MVSVLFCMKDSIYNSFDFADVYDIERNALTFDFSTPVVCHPPCRKWSRLRGFSNAPDSEKELAFFALRAVRQCGGVLEHPYKSLFWKAAKLPIGGEIDEFGGFSIDVDQFWWGHKARKRTWLYISGIERKNLPPFPLRFDAVTHKVGGSKTTGYGLKEISKSERNITPYPFCEWLLSVAIMCGQKKPKNK